MKIVIIGGHHISALVLAKKLKQLGHDIHWFGARYPRWPEKTEGNEYRQVTQEGILFYDLKAGKFHKNFLRWWRIPLGFIQVYWLLRRLKPDFIISFGGYLAVPAVLSGWFLGIASITHEQTRTAGLANRLIQFFVKKIFLTFPESAKFFNPKKSELVGLPIRKEFFSLKTFKIFKNNLPTISAIGGKQGSHIINITLVKALEKLLLSFNIIHQCGDILHGKDFIHLQEKRSLLPVNLQERYLVKNFFSDSQISQYLRQSDFVITRAGAHIVYELALLGKPAIFIPLPFAFADEQEENAKFFIKKGAGEIIKQHELNSQTLINRVEKMNKNLLYYKKNALKLKAFLPKNAVDKIVMYLRLYEKENKRDH